MEHNEYCAIWATAKTRMQVRLTMIVALLRSRLQEGFTVTDPTSDEGGDEWKIVANVMKGENLVFGLDFTLVDGGLQEDADGVGISLLILGMGGVTLGGFYPKNWTEEVWTTDVEEIARRIDAVDIEYFVARLLQHLTHPSVVADLAKAEA